MSTKVHVKNKLMIIIKHMIITNPEIEIPLAVEDYILENYGWAEEENRCWENDLNNFIMVFQKWLEDVYLPNNSVKYCKRKEVEYDFIEIFTKYLETELEYVNITLKLVQALKESVLHKQKCSEAFKTKCEFQEVEIDLMIQKLEFLRVQFLSNLYGEDNAMRGHLKLQEKLREELEFLKKCYLDAVKYNNQFDKIRTDKNFIELCKIYKELKKIESKTKLFTNL